jgi:hypothetical protein
MAPKNPITTISYRLLLILPPAGQAHYPYLWLLISMAKVVVFAEITKEKGIKMDIFPKKQ